MFGFVFSKDGYNRTLDTIQFPNGNLVIFDKQSKETIYSDVEEYNFTSYDEFFNEHPFPHLDSDHSE